MALAALLLGGISGQALAQAGGSSDGAAAQEEPTSAIEDIVVTATRREESLQKVPIAITAINAESLASAGITDVRQLTAVAPGFVGSRQNAAFLPTIRGVGSAGVSRNDESNVALYIDGVYQPDAATNITELVAIDRVEVLRGPQGTIFGRNATGGLVNIITPLPRFDVHGKVTVSFGGFGHALEQSWRSYLTGPITDTIAADLGVVVRRNDGYIRDLVRGGYLGEATLADFRSKQLFQLTDTFRIVTSVAYTSFNDNSGNTFQPFDNRTQARSVPGTILPTQPYEAAVDILPVSSFKRWNASLAASLDLGSVRLEVTTGFNDSNIIQAADTDASPILLGGNYSYPKSWSISQEVRALSAGSGPFQWIVGAYFFEQSGSVDVVNPSATSTTVLNSKAWTQAFAGFAEANYTIADALKITLGARYNTEERSFSNVNNGVLRVNNARNAAGRWTYRASAQYSFDNNNNVYVTYSTGFKSGVFNTLSSNPTPTRPETIKSIEAGLKLEPAPWLRVNLSAFHYDYRDLQVQARDPNSGTFILQNAANAKIKGAELEVTARPSRSLTLRATGTLLDAKYSSFTGAQVFIPQANGSNQPTTADVSGKSLVRSPKYTIQAGADWTTQLSSGEFTASFNLMHSARVYYDFANLASQEPYTMVNGQIGWGPEGAPWRVTLAVTNLTNARVAQQITAGPFGTYMTYERPRKVLGSLEVKF
jgi:iron complex outermembrane receptor protein